MKLYTQIITFCTMLAVIATWGITRGDFKDPALVTATGTIVSAWVDRVPTSPFSARERYQMKIDMEGAGQARGEVSKTTFQTFSQGDKVTVVYRPGTRWITAVGSPRS